MSQQVQGIVFDKDGTLVDFEHTWVPGLLAAADALMALHGLPDHAPELTRLAGGDPVAKTIEPGSLLAQGTAMEIAALWRERIPSLPPNAELAEWLDTFWVAQASENLTPVCDLQMLFNTLRAENIRIAIATNDAELGAHAMLDGLGLAHLVDFVAGYDSGYDAKPAPGMIHAFLTTHNLPASGVLMVGDNQADIDSGRAAGCRATVGVLSGASSREDLATIADFVLDDVSGIPALIKTAFQR